MSCEKGGRKLWVIRGGESEAHCGVKGNVLWEQEQGSSGLTCQDEVQELEGCLEAGAGDAGLVGVQGQEDQAAEEGQEASPHSEAAGHAVAFEDAVELRRVRLVLVAISQQGREDDEGEDLWVWEERSQGLSWSSVRVSSNPLILLGSPSADRRC